MNKKRITIEDLASMTQKGFSEMHARFNGIDEWQKLADGKFDSIEIELIDIRKKLDNIIYRHEFETLRERVKILEQRLAVARKK